VTSTLRLMCVLAHPDDESLGTGGVLAQYASEGVATYLVTATRGERGRYGDAEQSPGAAVVGRAREDELRAAASELGVREVSLLDYHDGDLDRVDPIDAIEKIAAHILRVKPDVVVTFDPFGAYGHADHIAISQQTAGGVARAAASGHRVSKFYYFVNTDERWRVYQAALKTLTATVDGTVRAAVAWPAWSITTLVDAGDHWQRVWRAVQCHKTQMSIYRKFESLTEADHRRLWGRQEFYRVFSFVNGGRGRETDLFEGLR
jgi:LmbE family N-acetylglucosaminyl deacetylase